jgi:hypothetical protein
MTVYRSPLTIYVVWHPGNQYGLRYAESIYNTFCRDVDSPLSRPIGIPVNFRYAPAKGSSDPLPLDIDTAASDRTAIVLLVDEEMFYDDQWLPYVSQLLKKEDDTSVRVYPVALSPYALSFNEVELNVKQFIDLTRLKNLEGKEDDDIFLIRNMELKSRLLHDLSRFMYKIERLSDISRQTNEPPVSLFISHAKVDGESLAIKFRDFVNSNLKLKTFFDANDIADALDFEDQIVNNLENSAIIVFLSDQYSTREWCRIEVIVAKRNKSPLVVVNSIEKGEKRSFPYLGNAPTIRHTNDNFNDIVNLTMYQVLNNMFLEVKLKKEVEMYRLNDVFNVVCLESPPELFNYIDIKRIQRQNLGGKPVLVIYPDPPLGIEELNVLNEMDETVQFITPSLIHKVI